MCVIVPEGPVSDGCPAKVVARVLLFDRPKSASFTRMPACPHVPVQEAVGGFQVTVLDFVLMQIFHSLVFGMIMSQRDRE